MSSSFNAKQQADLQNAMIDKAKKMLGSRRVSQVLAWQEGVLPHLPEPAFFGKSDEAAKIIYTKYCGANLSKFLIGSVLKTLAFLRFCDTYSLNLLLKENQVNRDDVYIVGIGCLGIYDENDRLIGTCRSCVKTRHVVYDELLFEELHPLLESAQKRNDEVRDAVHTPTSGDTANSNLSVEANNPRYAALARFAQVTEVENMGQDEKYGFWQNELKRCIRCNACRNICPVCHCKKCVFDGEKYDTRQIVNVSSFEEQMFHIIRAYHVAGRCSDCGQCSRVCPQKIQLHVLNRKFIKDINTFFGEYIAGEDATTLNPLVCFDIENDPEI